MKIIAVLFASAFLMGFTGCISSSKIHNEASVGKQLEDLDKSYKDGIITQKDYERLKKALIKKYD